MATTFLEKVYTILETCDLAIACWADDGKTFFVKQPKIFAEQYLPKYFRHQNFSSFVRQLNFYGFRKLRNEAAKTDQAKQNWWQFKHEKFLQGQRHLLGLIHRKTNNYGENSSVADLQTKVQTLERTVREMQTNFAQCRGMMFAMMQEMRTLREASNSNGTSTESAAACQAAAGTGAAGAGAAGTAAAGTADSTSPCNSNSNSNSSEMNQQMSMMMNSMPMMMTGNTQVMTNGPGGVPMVAMPMPMMFGMAGQNMSNMQNMMQMPAMMGVQVGGSGGGVQNQNRPRSSTASSHASDSDTGTSDATSREPTPTPAETTTGSKQRSNKRRKRPTPKGKDKKEAAAAAVGEDGGDGTTRKIKQEDEQKLHQQHQLATQNVQRLREMLERSLQVEAATSAAVQQKQKLGRKSSRKSAGRRSGNNQESEDENSDDEADGGVDQLSLKSPKASRGRCKSDSFDTMLSGVLTGPTLAGIPELSMPSVMGGSIGVIGGIGSPDRGGSSRKRTDSFDPRLKSDSFDTMLKTVMDFDMMEAEDMVPK